MLAYQLGTIIPNPSFLCFEVAKPYGCTLSSSSSFPFVMCHCIGMAYSANYNSTALMRSAPCKFPLYCMGNMLIF